MEKPQNYLSRLRRHPLLWNLALSAALSLARAVAAHTLMQLGTRHGARRTVPDLSGVQLDQAQRIARKHDLQLHINDSLFVPAYEQARSAAAHQRLAVRPRLRGRHHPRPTPRRRRGGEARAHGLHHDQLLPSEDGPRALRGRAFAAAGQEHARNRRTGDRRTGLPRRHGHELRAGGVLRRQTRDPHDPHGGRNGFRRDALRGRRRGLRHDDRAAAGGAAAGAGRGPPLGTGPQRRARGLRRRGQPAQPEGHARLHPDAGRRAQRSAGIEGRPAADARREETRPEEQQRADSLARTVLEEASAEPAEERPANNNEGFFD